MIDPYVGGYQYGLQYGEQYGSDGFVWKGVWPKGFREAWNMGFLDGRADFKADPDGFQDFEWILYDQQYCPTCLGTGDHNGYQCYDCDSCLHK